MLNYASNKIDEYNYDAYIAKYSDTLEEVAVVTYGDERDDYFTDLRMTEDECGSDFQNCSHWHFGCRTQSGA